MSQFKKMIALYFDGVLHSYTSPWTDAATISDGPTPGAMRFLRALVEDGRFEVKIVSSRCATAQGRRTIMAWIDTQLIEAFGDTKAYEIIRRLDAVAERPPAFLTIDDRAFLFQGTWPDLNRIASFRPWNKRPAQEPAPNPMWRDFVDKAIAAGVWSPPAGVSMEEVYAAAPSAEIAPTSGDEHQDVVSRALDAVFGRHGFQRERSSDGVWTLHEPGHDVGLTVDESLVPRDSHGAMLHTKGLFAAFSAGCGAGRKLAAREAKEAAPATTGMTAAGIRPRRDSEGDPEAIWIARLREYPDLPRRVVDATEAVLVALLGQDSVSRRLKGSAGWELRVGEAQSWIPVSAAAGRVMDLDAHLKDLVVGAGRSA